MKVQGNDLGMCGVEQLIFAGKVNYNDTGIDEGKAIHNVSSETGYRLRQDMIDLPCSGILDHLEHTLPVG